MTLAAARRAQIMAEVRQARSVNVTDLSRRFGVSHMTVRRDLDALARAGAVTRVHGGALADELPSTPSGTPGRPAPTSADVALAHAAARLIRPNTTIALTPGPRMYALACRVTGMSSVNVVTNSLWIAELLHEHGRGATTLLTGGLGSAAGGLIGPCVVNALRDIRVDALFTEADGIDARAGLTSAGFADAVAAAAFIDAADTVVVLAQSAQWGTVRLCPVAPLVAIDTLITDRVTVRMQAEIGRSIAHVVSLRKLTARKLSADNVEGDGKTAA